jgi:hypothetical protein
MFDSGDSDGGVSWFEGQGRVKEEEEEEGEEYEEEEGEEEEEGGEEGGVARSSTKRQRRAGAALGTAGHSRSQTSAERWVGFGLEMVGRPPQSFP